MSELSERNSVLVAYGLYLLGVVSGGLTTLVGVILAHVRLNAARGTLYESHYRNMILVFWVWLAVIAVAGAITLTSITGAAFSMLAAWPILSFAFIPAGLVAGLMMLAVAAAFVWYYWRLVRGLVLALDDKAF